MNKIKYIMATFLLVFVSCSTPDNSCPCTQNSATPLFSGIEVDSGFCTGELENPSPQTISYGRVCD